MTNGVKQGCVLTSTLFSMMCSAMLIDAFQDGDNGIPIRNLSDGNFSTQEGYKLNPRCRQRC